MKPFLIWFYKGSTYTDPIDGNSFRKLLPYGYETRRNNVLSPSTLSLERHRLLWIYLKNETNFFTSKTKKSVLHFAPEQAFFKRFKEQDNLDYTTTDLNSPIADIKADICHLPFPDNSYDIIFCNHVLEHIVNDVKAMQELFRVMKPGGWGIFQIPLDVSRAITFEDNSITDKNERAKVFGQYDHVRIYGMDYFEKLHHIGFKTEQIKYAKQLSEDDIKRFALDKTEIIPLVRK